MFSAGLLSLSAHDVSSIAIAVLLAHALVGNNHLDHETLSPTSVCIGYKAGVLPVLGRLARQKVCIRKK